MDKWLLTEGIAVVAVMTIVSIDTAITLIGNGGWHRGFGVLLLIVLAQFYFTLLARIWRNR